MNTTDDSITRRNKYKCKHKWVDMEDGSLDRICVRCRKFAMQAVMELPKLSVETERSSSVAINSVLGINDETRLIENIQKGLSGLSRR